MRKEMEEEIRAQLEANAMAMMSWDEKVGFMPFTCNFDLYVLFSALFSGIVDH